MMRVAVIGSGIAGLTCAHMIGKSHEVVVFEADDRLGGHANTVEVIDPAAGALGVDTGFIVHNDRNYPNFQRLLSELDIPSQDTEMSFAVTDRASGFSYRATNLNSLFADRANVVNPKMWRMLADIVRFYRNAKRHLAAADAADRRADGGVGGDGAAAAADINELTLGQFLRNGRYSAAFRDLHLIPMGAAVWSSDPSTFDEFPATSLFRFLDNHGLLGVGNRPQWQTVIGGSRHYVNAVAERFTGTVHLATPVVGVRRHDDGVTVRVLSKGDANGTTDRGTSSRSTAGSAAVEHEFDRAILACHSDQALEILSDASTEEKDVLGAIGYQPNSATLHTDISLLSPQPRAWAAWNYDRLGPADTTAAVTYDMTNLQRLPGSRRYLVSLNSDHRIDPSTVLARFDYAHPVFDLPAIRAQRRFEEIDGRGGVHFCGAYWGHGFHEDGMVAALRVCDRLDSTLDGSTVNGGTANGSSANGGTMRAAR